ncbi:MAG: transporter substrate-binding domain-containing protein [Oscillospiraceae bacterium]
MKKTKRSLALILALGLIISLFLTGCTIGGNEKYRIADNLEDQKLCVGFRLDDKAADAVIAALAVLQDDGTVKELSTKWFGSDTSLLTGNAEALNNLASKPEKRTFIIGYDPDRLPFSGMDENGKPTGFDVELARAVCDKLGWKSKFLPIDVSGAEVELNSGNVDCVWGGFPFDAALKITCSPVYMQNTVILASLAGSSVRSLGSLSGKTLTLGGNAYYDALLEKTPALQSKPEIIVRVEGGTKECFEALNNESCDAIITDKVAIEYYK